MIRILFAILLAVHGLIHLMGFSKAFNLAELKQLTQVISRFNGVLWLLTAVLFLITILFYLMKKDCWWMTGLVAVILSQIVIIASWQDAKWGTLANVIILFGVLLAYGSWNVNTLVRKELKEILPPSLPKSQQVTEGMLAGLPPVVQKWLVHSQVLNKEIIHTVKLQQTGMMRTALNGKWLPVTAEQYFNSDRPGFLWIADIAFLPLLHLSGRDKYQDGKGHMLIKLLSLFPIVNARGMEIDQGTMLRYLAEIIWFPSSALNSYISWEQIDSISAKATMTYGEITAAGVFTFTEDGDVKSFECMRYYSRKSAATLEKWYIEIDPNGYQEFQGIRIPAKSSVTWRLAEGDFTWLKLEITGIKFNQL